MKFSFALMSFLMTLSAFASMTDSDELRCTSKDRSVLIWNERYGELTVLDSSGDEVVSMDTLTLGKSRSVETSPPKWVTPILSADELNEGPVAVIEKMSGKTRILFDGDAFYCK